jgi:hypothetical protein
MSGFAGWIFAALTLITCTISSNPQPIHKALNKNLPWKMKAFLVIDIHWIGIAAVQFLLAGQMFGQQPLYLLQIEQFQKSKCFPSSSTKLVNSVNTTSHHR